MAIFILGTIRKHGSFDFLNSDCKHWSALYLKLLVKGLQLRREINICRVHASDYS